MEILHAFEVHLCLLQVQVGQRIHGDVGGGCFNKIPPQRQLDIKMHKKIIVCEYCGRILVDPELAGVKVEKTIDSAEKKTRKRAIRKTSSASSKKAADANDME